jgi:hypothetical protein
LIHHKVSSKPLLSAAAEVVVAAGAAGTVDAAGAVGTADTTGTTSVAGPSPLPAASPTSPGGPAGAGPVLILNESLNRAERLALRLCASL